MHLNLQTCGGEQRGVHSGEEKGEWSGVRGMGKFKNKTKSSEADG
jgi:hypothetical protein